MFLAKLIRSNAILCLLASTAFSASALDFSKKEQSHSHKGYFKPGAAVALTYDYDGQTELGALENITLTLQHHYSSGYISARPLETHDLNITSYQTLNNEKLQSKENLQLPIQISGTKSGTYFVSLEVIYESLSGQRNLRVLSLPIQIGEPRKAKTATPSTQKSNSISKKGLITFQANEIIK